MRQSADPARLTVEQTARMDADPWFGALPGERRRLLLAEAIPVRVQSGTRLYGAGDDPNGLWAVVEGQVRLVAYPASGAEILIRLLGPGVWCGELSTLDGGPRPHDAIAAGPGLAINVSPAAFSRLAEREPALWRDIALLGCVHQREALGFIGRQITQPAPVRLAEALRAACCHAGGSATTLRQAELAAAVGVSRQTLNRHLKALERRGLVQVHYARIEILDLEGLERLVTQAEA